MSVEIRTAAEILTPDRAGAWEARRAQRDDPVLRAIWRAFVDTGGPVSLEAVSRVLRELTVDVLRTRASALDGADLIGLEGERVVLAYPFTAEPNDFEVILPGGRRRFACCAIDALGVAPMLGAPVTVRSRCHRSGDPLVLDVDPEAGPLGAPAGIVAWVERGRWGGDRLSGFL